VHFLRNYVNARRARLDRRHAELEFQAVISDAAPSFRSELVALRTHAQSMDSAAA
jgi:hypothetical protein